MININTWKKKRNESRHIVLLTAARLVLQLKEIINISNVELRRIACSHYYLNYFPVSNSLTVEYFKSIIEVQSELSLIIGFRYKRFLVLYSFKVHHKLICIECNAVSATFYTGFSSRPP